MAHQAAFGQERLDIAGKFNLGLSCGRQRNIGSAKRRPREQAGEYSTQRPRSEHRFIICLRASGEACFNGVAIN
jgi:hypothetical protein